MSLFLINCKYEDMATDSIYDLLDTIDIYIPTDSCIIVPHDSCFYQGTIYLGDNLHSLGEMESEYLFVGFDPTKSWEEIIQYLKSQFFFIDRKDDSLRYEGTLYYNGISHINFKYSLNQFIYPLDCYEITTIIETMKQHEIVQYVHYTIKTDDCLSPKWEPMGTKCILAASFIFYVYVKDKNNLDDLYSMANKTNTKILFQNSYIPELFTLYADKYSLGNTIKMANYFYESGLFDTAVPEIIKVPVEFYN